VGWFVLPLPANWFFDGFKYGWLYLAVALTFLTGYWYIRAWLNFKDATTE